MLLVCAIGRWLVLAKQEAHLADRMRSCRFIGLDVTGDTLHDGFPVDWPALSGWRTLFYGHFNGNGPYIDRKQPWNAPANERFANLPVTSVHALGTNVGRMFAIRGEGSAFDHAIDQIPFEVLPNDAVLLVEVCGSDCNWLEPGDVYLDNQPRPGIKLISWPGPKPCPDGFCITFADASIWRMKSDTPPDLVLKMATLEFAKNNHREDVLGTFAVDQWRPMLP